MTEIPTIQWFPGHMAKTRRMIREWISQVDCVCEVTDARIPESSRNPDLDALVAGKPEILLMNKCDLADESVTADWMRYYKAKGIPALPADCKSGKGLNRFIPAVRDLLRDQLQRYAQKGMAGRSIRVMIAGIPNSGKSTFINRMAGSRRAKAENRPGVTRGRQWISLGSGIEMLDTPGILWPKFEDPAVGEKLAFIGSIKDDVVDTELLSSRLLECLAPNYANALRQRYKLSGELPEDGFELLSQAAQKRGFLLSGGVADTQRAASIVLEEFRNGKLGRISLERPQAE